MVVFMIMKKHLNYVTSSINSKSTKYADCWSPCG